MCAATRPDGGRCQREATAAVDVDDLVQLLCDADAWAAARAARGEVQVRELSDPRSRMVLSRRERLTS